MKKIIVVILIILLLIIVGTRNNIFYKNSILLGDINTSNIGDINMDGKVNAQDYILIRKYIIKIGSLNDSQKKLADMNQDNKLNTMDYILIKKQILGSNNSSIVKNLNQYIVSFVGSDIISTGFEGKEVLIKGGKVSEHRSNASKLHLEINTRYVVSFDYLAKGGTNEFDVDLYPDSLPQVILTGTTTKQHYDWILSSDNGDIGNSQLRFFDDIRSNSEGNISITNILMSKVIDKKYDEGTTLGTLPTPTRDGYRFIGWFTEPTGGEEVSENSQVTSNMTLFPHWKGMYDHVFIVGIDGLGDTFGTNKVDATNFKSIFGEYAFSHNTKTENNTWSAPNWTSIMTGVTWETHGIDNDKAGTIPRTSTTTYPTIFYYVKKEIPNAKLASIVNWNPINIGIIENDLGMYKDNVGVDSEVTNKVVSYLETNKSSEPTLMFIHLCDVDHAAHNYVKKNGVNGCKTCGGYSDEYYNAAKGADGMLGTIYQKIDSLGLMQNSLFVVVADHGETYNSHGNPKTATRDIKEEVALLAIRGYNVNKMTFSSDVHNRDLSAIVLYALGIDKPEVFISSVPTGLFK